MKTIQTKWTALDSIYLYWKRHKKFKETSTILFANCTISLCFTFSLWLYSNQSHFHFPLQNAIHQRISPNCLFLNKKKKKCAEQIEKSPSTSVPYSLHWHHKHISVTIYIYFSCFLQYIFHYSLELGYTMQSEDFLFCRCRQHTAAPNNTIPFNFVSTIQIQCHFVLMRYIWINEFSSITFFN